MPRRSKNLCLPIVSAVCSLSQLGLSWSRYMSKSRKCHNREKIKRMMTWFICDDQMKFISLWPEVCKEYKRVYIFEILHDFFGGLCGYIQMRVRKFEEKYPPLTRYVVIIPPPQFVWVNSHQKHHFPVKILSLLKRRKYWFFFQNNFEI